MTISGPLTNDNHPPTTHLNDTSQSQEQTLGEPEYSGISSSASASLRTTWWRSNYYFCWAMVWELAKEAFTHRTRARESRDRSWHPVRDRQLSGMFHLRGGPAAADHGTPKWRLR